jgi:carbon monoxide dehydrogenase subunit G
METTRSVEIDRPIEAVFKYTLHNVAEWSIVVVEDEVTSDGPVGVGTTFRSITEERGDRMEFSGKVTKHEPPTAHSVFMTGKSFDLVVDYTFEAIDGGTRLTQHSQVNAKGFIKVMFFLLGWLMKGKSCDALDKELASLKKCCEEKVPA